MGCRSLHLKNYFTFTDNKSKKQNIHATNKHIFLPAQNETYTYDDIPPINSLRFMYPIIIYLIQTLITKHLKTIIPHSFSIVTPLPTYTYDTSGNMPKCSSSVSLENKFKLEFVYKRIEKKVYSCQTDNRPQPTDLRFAYKFSSEVFAPKTNLVYYRYRYPFTSLKPSGFYERTSNYPDTARWLKRDPIGEKGGNNLYEICDNDCVNFRDYLGFYTLDSDGNLLSDGKQSYTWNGENRCIEIVKADDYKLEFKYDYQGRRFEKKVYSWTGSAWQLDKTEKYVWDNWNLIATFDASDALQKSFLWPVPRSSSGAGGGEEGVLAEKNSSGTYLALQDGNKNITAYIDSSDGSIAAEYEYAPFGRTISKSGPMADEFAHRFAGYYFDPETGLIYYGYRYYDADMGRWINRDPIGEKGFKVVFKNKRAKGFEPLYVMVGNDTVNRFDYLGLSFVRINKDSHCEKRRRKPLENWSGSRCVKKKKKCFIDDQYGFPGFRTLTLKKYQGECWTNELGDPTRQNWSNCKCGCAFAADGKCIKQVDGFHAQFDVWLAGSKSWAAPILVYDKYVTKTKYKDKKCKEVDGIEYDEYPIIFKSWRNSN